MMQWIGFFILEEMMGSIVCLYDFQNPTRGSQLHPAYRNVYKQDRDF